MKKNLIIAGITLVVIIAIYMFGFNSGKNAMKPKEVKTGKITEIKNDKVILDSTIISVSDGKHYVEKITVDNSILDTMVVDNDWFNVDTISKPINGINITPGPLDTLKIDGKDGIIQVFIADGNGGLKKIYDKNSKTNPDYTQSDESVLFDTALNKWRMRNFSTPTTITFPEDHEQLSGSITAIYYSKLDSILISLKALNVKSKTVKYPEYIDRPIEVIDPFGLWISAGFTKFDDASEINSALHIEVREKIMLIPRGSFHTESGLGYGGNVAWKF